MFFLIVPELFAQEGYISGYADSLETNLRLMKRYLSQGSNWHFTDTRSEKMLSGLIHFLEDEPIDTIVTYFERLKNNAEIRLISRRAEDVPDSLQVPGYISSRQLARQLEEIDEQVKREYAGRQVVVPSEILKEVEKQVQLVPEGNGMTLFTDGIYSMPDSLKRLDAIPDKMIQSPADFKRILELDEIRSRYVEQKRLQYNDSILRVARQKVADRYRQSMIDERSEFLRFHKIEAVRQNNLRLLQIHNEQAVVAVNDSLRHAAVWLAGFANLFDNVQVNLMNLSRTSAPLVLSNAGRFFTRVWLKNQQNDSISVLVQSLDKRSMQLVIEDGVTFSRFRQQAVKDFDFTTLNRPSSNLEKISKRYQAYTPWTIGGNGNLGFTQTYLSNWKKGGKSALSILVVAKGFANFSSEKVKWENSGEIRNGWIKPGDDRIQKNDDKLELTSRLGISAFQKWYYSTEADFETQFFNGYKYPDRTKPISGYMAPAKFLFKLGLDYKPSKTFSLLISPLTSKLVFVQDTLKVNKLNYGIQPGKKSIWQPGINTDINYKKNITSTILFETKYKMFLNYLKPFRDIDLNWENTLTVQLNDYISMQVMAHSIYDSKILFDKTDKNGNPVLDSNGKKIMEPKMQFKEFLTVGFSYRINRRVIRAREVK
jgi:hypothetical protein